MFPALCIGPTKRPVSNTCKHSHTALHSYLISWLYLASRSDLHGAPVFIYKKSRIIQSHWMGNPCTLTNKGNFPRESTSLFTPITLAYEALDVSTDHLRFMSRQRSTGGENPPCPFEQSESERLSVYFPPILIFAAKQAEKKY